MSLRWLLPGCLLLLAIASADPVSAQPAPSPSQAAATRGESFAETLSGWKGRLEFVEGTLASDDELSQAESSSLARILSQITSQTRAQTAVENQALAPLNEQLAALGPEPAEGDPPEPEAIAAQRAEIKGRIAEVEGRLRQTAFVEVRALELLSTLSRLDQERLREALLTRSKPPVTLAIWHEATLELAGVLERIGSTLFSWVEENISLERGLAPYALLGGAIGLAILLGWPTRRWVSSHWGPDPANTDPSYARRILAVAAEGLARALIPAFAIGIVLAALLSQNLVSGFARELAITIAGALTLFVLTVGVAVAALAPRNPAWRIVPVTPQGAVSLAGLVTLLAVFIALADIVWKSSEAGRGASWGSAVTGEAFVSVFLLISTTVIAVLLLLMLRAQWWQGLEAAPGPEQAEGTEEERAGLLPEDPWPLLRAAARILVLASPVIALVGYGRLAAFLIFCLLASVLIGGLALLIRAAAREGLSRLFAPGGPLGRKVSGHQAQAELRLASGLFWLQLLLDAVILVATIGSLAWVVGVPLTTLQLWSGQVLGQIEIGEISFSLTDTVLSIVVLLIGLFLARAIRHWLSHRVLPNTRLDVGARDSIAAGIGYVGIGIAIMLAITTLGISFSNVALVAGALSVGIGFGLRTVTENFVAGLLLLIERPIKVGDWIVAGGNEGTVKHIAVRSTEIETFDRATVFVPNSELIASAVTNWTHKNRIIRIFVFVRVAYGSDAEQVREILLDCARRHERVLRYPESVALLRNFGPDGYEFELRAFLSDTDYFLSARSELHFMVDKALREAGIQVPRAQRELHLPAGWPRPEAELVEMPEEAPPAEAPAEDRAVPKAPKA